MIKHRFHIELGLGVVEQSSILAYLICHLFFFVHDLVNFCVFISVWELIDDLIVDCAYLVSVVCAFPYRRLYLSDGEWVFLDVVSYFFILVFE